MQAAPPNPSEARALVVQNVLVQDGVGSATAAGFKASAALSVEKPKRLHRMRPTCPLVLASSRFIFCLVAQLLSVGTAENRPNMGPQGQGMYISENIYVYFPAHE